MGFERLIPAPPTDDRRLTVLQQVTVETEVGEPTEAEMEVSVSITVT